jgi:hypothetical protein
MSSTTRPKTTECPLALARYLHSVAPIGHHTFLASTRGTIRRATSSLTEDGYK